MKLWLIWSIEHNAWWAPAERGYVKERSQAGRYDFDRACEIVREANYNPNRPPNETMVADEEENERHDK